MFCPGLSVLHSAVFGLEGWGRGSPTWLLGRLRFVLGIKAVREVLRSGMEWGAGMTLSRVRFLSG